MKKNIILMLMACCVAIILSSCADDYYLKDITTNERSILGVSLGGGLVQVGPAVINKDSNTVSVRVLLQDGVDLSKVKLSIAPSYKAQITPSVDQDVDFIHNNYKTTYTVTAESGKTKDWTIKLIPFTEVILGTYKIQNLVVFGGTGQEYGGSAVLSLTDKPWDWPATGGPSAELDNTLTLEFSGVTADGKTYGTITNDKGGDGLYADYQYIGQPMSADVNHFYRTMPKGVGTWQHDYTANTISFLFDGKIYTCVYKGASTVDLGVNDHNVPITKTITDNSFEFTPTDAVDDWTNIYSDYDKFAKKVKKFWIDVKKQN